MTTLSAFFVIFCCFIIIGVNGDTNLGTSDFKCPNGASIYPHPECDKYYTCYTGEPTNLWQCKNDLLFDLVYNGCNYPGQTYCGDRTRPNGNNPTTTTTAKTTIITFQPPISCVEDGFFPAAYQRSCTNSFFICLDGKAYLNACPSYGVFDPVGRRCISPSAPACFTYNNSTVTQTTQTAPQTSPFTQCGSSSEIGSQSTPGAANMSTTIKQTSSTSTETFTCPNSNGLFPSSSSCSKYYQCNNGIYYLFTCPNGLVFNPNLQICDWPYNVPSCSKA